MPAIRATDKPHVRSDEYRHQPEPRDINEENTDGYSSGETMSFAPPPALLESQLRLAKIRWDKGSIPSNEPSCMRFRNRADLVPDFASSFLILPASKATVSSQSTGSARAHQAMVRHTGPVAGRWRSQPPRKRRYRSRCPQDANEPVDQPSTRARWCPRR